MNRAGLFSSELDRAWQELTAPGAAFEMETIDLAGVPTRIFRNVPRTVRDLWLNTQAFGDRDYVIFGNERVTYAEAHNQVAAIANWLVANGIGRGQRVAIAMRNYPEWMLAYWAAVSVGACVVGLNAWWTGEELAYALKDSRPALIVCDRERMERIRAHVDGAALPRLVVTRIETPPADVVAWRDLLTAGTTMPVADLEPDDDANIFYTSGTTGVPKGAVLTHRNCITNIYNIMFAGQAQSLAARRAGAAAPQAPPRPVTLIPTPFFHVTGNNCLAYSVTVRGGAMVLMYKWDAGEAIALIERERISEVSGVPVMAREILNHPRLPEFDTSSLISLAGGGASFQQDLIGKVEQRLSSARPRTGYGMTETSGSVTTISADFLIDRPSSVGRVLPTFDTRLIDEEGQDVAEGEPGELLVRGGAVFRGYLNNPEANAETITDGWLHTGDLARLDEDGFLYIVGRQKDMIIRGGENVYCAEVENSIQQHPDVAECCVFGIPDERLGEAVAAAILLAPGVPQSTDLITEYCKDRLARHKIPSRIWFLDRPIPRNATGKFMKRELRASLTPRHSDGSTEDPLGQNQGGI